MVLLIELVVTIRMLKEFLKVSTGLFFLLVLFANASSAFAILHKGSHGCQTKCKEEGPSTPVSQHNEKKRRLFKSCAQLPLCFIKNQGQLDKQVKYYEKGLGRAMFFTANGIFLRFDELARNPSGRSLVQLMPLGMEKGVRITTDDPQKGVMNYFIGNDPDKWKTNLPTYGSIIYRNAYPHSDLKFYGNNQQLEYDVVIRKGGDPSKIRFQVRGIESLDMTERGDLAMKLEGGGVLTQRKPVIYQEIAGERVDVGGAFKILRKDSRFVYGFEVAFYDKRHPLIIDPTLSYSTFLGGKSWDMANSVAVDAVGNVYVAGWTESKDFPLNNPLQGVYEGDEFVYITDVFVTKMNARGNALIYSTFLGGSIYRQGNAADYAKHIVVDDAGNAYITGNTTSVDFPTKNPIQPKLAGRSDAFVAKINPDGNALLYSTYIGGSGLENGVCIGLDASGNGYVTGHTSSTDFPTRNPIQQSSGGGFDAFVIKINDSGSALDYATYLGGSREDYANHLAVGVSGKVAVTGHTKSIDFPTKRSVQRDHAGGLDVFVASIKPRGKALDYATYLGGEDDDYGYGIALDSSGNAYVTGKTNSSDFPTKNALQESKYEHYDVFLTKIKSHGKALVYSTYLGGNSNDIAHSIAVDSASNVYVMGDTRSTDFPVKNSLQELNAGMLDLFVTKIKASGKVLGWSTYLGGFRDEHGRGIALDSSGGVYLTGWTDSANFPVKDGFQLKKSKSCDCFVMKVVQ